MRDCDMRNVLMVAVSLKLEAQVVKHIQRLDGFVLVW